MLPIYLALLSYFLTAVVFLVDKYLLSASIPRPLAYAFWVAILSSFAIFLIPFGVTVLSPEITMMALISGMTMFLGLIFFYESIMVGDISVASTKVGAFSALFGYLLSLLIFPNGAKELNLPAAVSLIGGIFFLARTHGKVVFQYAILAGFFGAVSIVTLKWVFDNSTFINGIFWTRVFFVATAFLVFLSPEARSQIGKFVSRSSRGSKVIFLSNKLLAAISFLILYLAVNLGQVATIHALLGFQFVFVFVLALALRPHFPKLEQNLNKNVLVNKIIGISLIILGFSLILI